MNLVKFDQMFPLIQSGKSNSSQSMMVTQIDKDTHGHTHKCRKTRNWVFDKLSAAETMRLSFSIFWHETRTHGNGQEDLFTARFTLNVNLLQEEP